MSVKNDYIEKKSVWDKKKFTAERDLKMQEVN